MRKLLENSGKIFEKLLENQGELMKPNEIFTVFQLRLKLFDEIFARLDKKSKGIENFEKIVLRFLDENSLENLTFLHFELIFLSPVIFIALWR